MELENFSQVFLNILNIRSMEIRQTRIYMQTMQNANQTKKNFNYRRAVTNLPVFGGEKIKWITWTWFMKPNNVQ